MNNKIFVILPYKESLKPNFAGAVSIYANDTTNLSKYKKKIKIISTDNKKKKDYLKIKTIYWIFAKNIIEIKSILLKFTIDQNIYLT